MIVREDESNDKRLIAYLVPQNGHNPTAGELRTFLKERVPEYMVPAAFVTLEQMPLTSNGKVDRHALPGPEAVGSAPESGFVAPRTPLEEEVATAWKQVLGLERVGVNDNFFEIGGHSLLATRVIILLRNLGVNFSLRLLFENPTVAGMASVLVETLSELADQPAHYPMPESEAVRGLYVNAGFDGGHLALSDLGPAQGARGSHRTPRQQITEVGS